VRISPLLVHRDQPNCVVSQAAVDWQRLFTFRHLGLDSVSLLLPCEGLSWFVTFWPKSKELGRVPTRTLELQYDRTT